MVELYHGSLPIEAIFEKWHETIREKNFGAFIPFVGIVRDEGGIEGLSFDVYEPLLREWFEAWKLRALEKGAVVMMAHSMGDVALHTSSYIAAVASPQRKVALQMIEEFVEDFKATAPIWKYDLREGKRIYAKDRSTPLPHSGLLSLC